MGTTIGTTIVTEVDTAITKSVNTGSLNIVAGPNLHDGGALVLRGDSQSGGTAGAGGFEL